MSRITMKDIAQVCGVSVMTVSNAFNRPDQLSAELRERILARAEKMGYGGPDARARDLRSGRSHSYGVVFSERLSYAFTDPFATEWLAGFSQAMEAQGAGVLLLSVPVWEPGAIAAVRNAAIDGLAGLCASNIALDAVRQRGLPVVVTSASSDVDQVVIDDRAAGLDLARHIVRLGHRRVTLVAEALDERTPVPVEVAVPDFVQVSTDAVGSRFHDDWGRWTGLFEGLEGLDVRVVIAGTNARESGHAAAPLILDRADRPSAVIGISDVMALGVLDGLAERGITPGRDISVAGFDDLPGISERAGLTTIRQPIRDKGRLAAELLLDPTRQPRRIVLPHELVVRRSTGPAPTR